MVRLKGKKILLGVGGGIAAYKVCDLASKLTKEGALVTAIMTKNARKIVTPYAFEAVTGQPCLTKLWRRLQPEGTPFPHITPARDADLVLVAPATADLIAKFAHGLADDLLTTLMLTVRCPVLICPAMNVQMWEHPATKANIHKLQEYGYQLVGPASGSLACGMEGAGRLCEPVEILEFACKALKSRKSRCC